MKIKMLMMAAMMFLSTVAFALDRQVPQLFNYQAALTDEGGNLLPDGIIEAKFEVLDASGEVVYAETQDVEVVKGNVSAMVGNGLDVTSGAPTGGVPLSALDPTEARFLRVTASGHSAYDPLEMVGVPYSMWSQMALAMPEGSITGAMIGKGVITKEHLDNELLESIYPDGLPRSLMPSDAVYKEDFTKFSDTIQSSNGAASVGVATDFIYSGSRTVQGVLKDLDLAVKKRNEEVEWAKADYDAKVASEAVTRSASDSNLQNNINTEANSRQVADNAHAASTSTHGVAGDIVGTFGNQTLMNKILVAPIITGGITLNNDLGLPLSESAGLGVVVDGKLTVTGNVRSKETEIEGDLTVKEDANGNGKIKTKAVFNENATARLTPFAYGTIHPAQVEGSLQITNFYNAITDGSYNSRKVFFETPATDANYVVMLDPHPYKYAGNDYFTMVVKKEVDGFSFSYPNMPYSGSGIDFVVFDDN